MATLSGRNVRVALAGGGSGGHIYPLIAVASELKEQARLGGFILELHYYGANDRFRKDIEVGGIHFHSLLTGKLRRYASLLTLLDIPKILLGIVQAFFEMYFLMPDVIFSKGGPGAFPIVLAGWFYKIPIVIHESDSVPGLTTLTTARFAKKIILSWEQTVRYFDPRKTVLAGNPVRPELLAARLSQSDAKLKLGFDPARPLIFVSGGSQGAAKLNEFTILNLGAILPLAQILHQTGPENFIEAKKLSEAELLQLPTSVSTQSRYEVVGYLNQEEMRDALTAADLVLSRAGSGSIFEATAFGKPLILVPLGSAARDHQRENAQAFAQAGGGIVIEEANLTASIFINEIGNFLANPSVLQAMAQSSTSFSKPEAARTISVIILELV